MHHVGVDFYPEHWPRERWPEYARWMQEAGFTVVRVAEFAWAFLEPEEGRFDFALFDEAIALLGRHGISVILGTPTAVMPTWVKEKYPECLQQEASGKRAVWGVRKNNCFTAGAYRLLSERVTRAMADHFRDTPNVIGWQTDNEFGQNSCTCATCQAEFRVWLRNRHGTLDALNAAWGTHFWGHTYRAWDEIGFPDGNGSHNPGHLLDWQRFGSWLNVRFQRDQVRILRATCPKHFVTHNFMGLFQDLDYWALAEDLDHVSWDNYPVWGAEKRGDLNAAAAADIMRGLKKRNFWIMEQTAGPCGWGEFGRNVRPGELALISWQQVAHGADATIWFRWRSCTVGREQYWHGLLGHDGQPRRRYREAAAYAKAIHAIERDLDGTAPRAEAAIFYDYDSLWAMRFQPGFKGANYQNEMLRWYGALRARGIGVAMVKPGDDLSAYKLVVAPMLHVLPDAIARGLVDWTRAGGVLVTGIRTGVKDEHNRCHERCLPGLLGEALGIRIEEYDGYEGGYAVAGSGPLDGAWTAEGYADWVLPDGAETLARFQAWHLADYAAATRHRFGQGWGYYLGFNAKEAAVQERIVGDALAKAGIAPLLAPIEGVEVAVREGQGRTLVFVLNQREEPVRVPVPAGKRDLLTGQATGAELVLDRLGVAVLRW